MSDNPSLELLTLARSLGIPVRHLKSGEIELLIAAKNDKRTRRKPTENQREIARRLGITVTDVMGYEEVACRISAKRS